MAFGRLCFRRSCRPGRRTAGAPNAAAALGWKAAARDALTALCLGVSVAKPVDACALALPRDSQPELRRTAFVCRGDDAGGRIRNVGVRGAEVVVIQKVEDLGPEFDASVADRKPLAQRQVHLLRAGPTHGVATRGALGSECRY